VIQHIFGFATSYRPISFSVFEDKYFSPEVKLALLDAEHQYEMEKSILDLANSKEFAEEKQLSKEILAIDKACRLHEKKWSFKSILPRKRNF
jgi:hypothetical protein